MSSVLEVAVPSDQVIFDDLLTFVAAQYSDVHCKSIYECFRLNKELMPVFTFLTANELNNR